MCYACDGDCAFYARESALDCVQEARENGETTALTDREAALEVARWGNDESVGDEWFEATCNARGQWIVRHHPTVARRSR